MLRTLLISFVVSGLLLQYCDKNTGIILLSNPEKDSTSEIPLEIDPRFFRSEHNVLTAQAIEDPETEFVLQKCAALFNNGTDYFTHTFCTILPQSAPDGRYRISPTLQSPVFSFLDNGNGQMTIAEAGKPVFTYNYGRQLKDGVPERYRRSSYIHPVYDLMGNILTDDFPDDHYHHRGLSWMWPKVFVNGIRYDLWHIYGMQGELPGIHQVFEKWIIKDTGPICATLAVKNVWELEDNRKVMDEWVYIRTFRACGETRTIDIKLVWKALEPVSIEGQDVKGYGGLNFRFAPRNETTITSLLGREKDSDLKEIPWADESGKFGSNDYFSGVSIFQHQKNADFPAGWCMRHYGFLGVAWPGIDPYKMKKGDRLSLRFRILIHQGNADESRVRLAYRIFKDPPQIKLLNNE